MNSIYHDIFRAIHEGKWLRIEYRNKLKQVTKYWIGIKNIDVKKKSLMVDGLHLGKYTTSSLDCIYIDSILSSQVVEGSYCDVNKELVNDIYLNPHKYINIFDNTVNLKVLTYLEKCYLMDTVPYEDNFELIKFLDRDSFDGDIYKLSDEQFEMIVKYFQMKMENKSYNNKLVMQQLAMNVLSIHTSKGLYVLAYRKLNLDVKDRVLRPSKDITICTEYVIDGYRESIRKFLDADDYELLENFEKNEEKIKDLVAKHSRLVMGVDDMPYMIGLGMNILIDLHKEYEGIINMFNSDKVTVPIKAFFGDLLNRPIRRKEYPISIINKNINLDQLLAISKGMKYPLAYVQGPPGTGKTNTIINTLITAFINKKTVLFTSYNNHPINGVFDKLCSMKYNENTIPFPVLRLGSSINIAEAIKYIRELYLYVKDIDVANMKLELNREQPLKNTKKLAHLLKEYDVVLELKERRDTLKRMIEYQEKSYSCGMGLLTLYTNLYGKQLEKVNRQLEKIGEISEKEAISLLDTDYEQLYEYLYYVSVEYIKKLQEPQFEELREIIFDNFIEVESNKESDTDYNKEFNIEDNQVKDIENNKDTDINVQEIEKLRIKRFTEYINDSNNIKKLQKVFPIIITTCLSAYKIGKPEPLFDMVVMDEASQCNTAVSLVPIIRGESLMLVGDPQQLSPVIVLNEHINRELRLKYNISDEYDYCKNSVYKTFLACDCVSDEILLHNHYRCNKKIIGFNNKKYYNNRLSVLSESKDADPLVYMNVKNDSTDIKNTAPSEVETIIEYALLNKDKSIGIITPFVNQRKMIEEQMKSCGITNITCGTVHAFQGDEKDVILFSTAITDKTSKGTYDWLKNNKELINVATSRAREKLVVLADYANLNRLHTDSSEDDLYELVDYVKKNGKSEVTMKKTYSRALGVKPYSTATESAFLESLTHALENIWLSDNNFIVHKEVAISQVFENNITYNDLFYTGRFDFVVYQRRGTEDIPVLAIELDGKEHYENEIVMERDRKKNEICRAHNLQLIRVESSYARRYNHIKEILISYFRGRY